MATRTGTQRFWRWIRFGGAGVATAATAQAVQLRLNYVSPEEPEGQLHGLEGKNLKGPPLKLLFVGDSLCMGVGAQIAAPLQKACAERLSKLRERQVVWCTVAATGADVRELRALFKARQESEGSGAFDIAVVLCGVNDGKKFLQGRFPSVFRRDLDALCASLRQVAPEGRISLPRIDGYAGAPLLQRWPMCYLVGPMCRLFEAQKEDLAAENSFHCPSAPLGELPGPQDMHLWSGDGIHPSCEGYRVVGEWLGSALATE